MPESWNSRTGSSSEMELMETFIQLDMRGTERLKDAVLMELGLLLDLAVDVALRDLLPRGREPLLDGSPITAGLASASIFPVKAARRASLANLLLRSMVSKQRYVETRRHETRRHETRLW